MLNIYYSFLNNTISDLLYQLNYFPIPNSTLNHFNLSLIQGKSGVFYVWPFFFLSFFVDVISLMPENIQKNVKSPLVQNSAKVYKDVTMTVQS